MRTGRLVLAYLQAKVAELALSAVGSIALPQSPFLEKPQSPQRRYADILTERFQVSGTWKRK